MGRKNYSIPFLAVIHRPTKPPEFLQSMEMEKVSSPKPKGRTGRVPRCPEYFRRLLRAALCSKFTEQTVPGFLSKAESAGITEKVASEGNRHIPDFLFLHPWSANLSDLGTGTAIWHSFVLPLLLLALEKNLYWGEKGILANKVLRCLLPGRLKFLIPSRFGT